MDIRIVGSLGIATILAGCAGTLENPADHFTYRNEPLVQQVDNDMSKQQVLEIGGPPSSETARTVQPGTCNDYILTRDGHQQPYYVSFNSAARVDGQGFMTCKMMESNERARRS